MGKMTLTGRLDFSIVIPKGKSVPYPKGRSDLPLSSAIQMKQRSATAGRHNLNNPGSARPIATNSNEIGRKEEGLAFKPRLTLPPLHVSETQTPTSTTPGASRATQPRTDIP